MALGTWMLAQLSTTFQSPLALFSQTDLGAVPGPSSTASSANADKSGPDPPPFCQPRKTRTCVALAGATPLTLYGVQTLTAGFDAGVIVVTLGVPTWLFDASSHVIFNVMSAVVLA